MGDNGKPVEKSALFEITVKVHPEVLRHFLLKRDGAWGHFWGLVLPCLWLLAGCMLQLALCDSFPELPLHVLPLAVAYVAENRRPGGAVLGALAAGAVYDVLTFGQLGVTSCNLGLAVILVRYLCESLDGIGSRLWERSLLLGGGAAFLYVASRLILMAVMDSGMNALELMPRQLLLGTLVSGGCLAPVLFSVMDAAEWLLGLRRKVSTENGARASRKSAAEEVRRHHGDKEQDDEDPIGQ